MFRLHYQCFARTSKDISLEVLSIHRSSHKTAQAAKVKKKNFPTKARARAAAQAEDTVVEVKWAIRMSQGTEEGCSGSGSEGRMKGWNGSSNMTVDEGPSSATIARVDGKEKAYRVPETKIENGIDGRDADKWQGNGSVRNGIGSAGTL
jgi:hypothetical protein